MLLLKVIKIITINVISMAYMHILDRRVQVKTFPGPFHPPTGWHTAANFQTQISGMVIVEGDRNLLLERFKCRWVELSLCSNCSTSQTCNCDVSQLFCFGTCVACSTESREAGCWHTAVQPSLRCST